MNEYSASCHGGVRSVRLDGTLARETIARQVAAVLRNDGILD
jgi:hypothetical protein